MNMINDAAQIAQHEVNRAVQAAHRNAAGGEFLTFRLGAEEYGIDILRVQEIRSYEQPTRIANAPAFIKGVVNLRGTIVPIVDLRVKLGCEKVDIDSFTVVIVLNVKGRVVGAVVDSVSDVMQLTGEQVKPAPEIASANVDTSYITGIGSINAEGKDRMLILVDIEALMSSAEMGLIEQVAA
jgi:purine-binding chemotaxis protein CheW